MRPTRLLAFWSLLIIGNVWMASDARGWRWSGWDAAYYFFAAAITVKLNDALGNYFRKRAVRRADAARGRKP